MRYPVNYLNITQGYHQGKCLDMGWGDEVGQNQPIYAVANATVYSVETQANGGNVIYLKHDDGKCSCYAHLSKILVKEGQKVSLGEQIGNMGATGKVTGPHLHFGLFTSVSVRYKDSTLDPFDYLELYEGQTMKPKTEEVYGGLIKRHKEEPEKPVNPTPTETEKEDDKEIKVGDTVIVNGVGTASSDGSGAKTKKYTDQKMKVIGISNNTSRPNRYALNQYNKGTVGKWSDVTGWFSINSIRK